MPESGESAKPIRIVLVGHCGPDSYALRSAVGRQVPGSEVVFAHHDEALEEELTRADLLLINRTLDGDFSDDGGVDMIRRLVAETGGTKPRLMLVSNFPEVQAQAEMAGAAPGFGKAAMNSETTRERLRAALGM